ncbi:hypothetical protein An01g05250 [Aspergillus niger]|uniref:Uncharacterized protein n=2 Tax=Aspergillus niger TaxID=5061 RepID=A2Q8R1_ASPNC|nr:hypothetical protein An01g05250 [Aspergillus niger]CAK37058.1 hypothetical protein An01g05250 [Aspergillus niger]
MIDQGTLEAWRWSYYRDIGYEMLTGRPPKHVAGYRRGSSPNNFVNGCVDYDQVSMRSSASILGTVIPIPPAAKESCRAIRVSCFEQSVSVIIASRSLPFDPPWHPPYQDPSLAVSLHIYL